MTLKYLEDAVEALLSQDTLVVMAPGLGLHQLILAFLKAYLRFTELSVSSTPSSRCSETAAAGRRIPENLDNVSSHSSELSAASLASSLEKSPTVLCSKAIIVLNTSAEEADVLVRQAALDSDDVMQTASSLKKMAPSSDKLESDTFHTTHWAQTVFVSLQGINALSGSLADQRQQLYAKGGVFLVPSRLFVTDMLSGRLPPEMVDGVIVNHAHRFVCA